MVQFKWCSNQNVEILNQRTYFIGKCLLDDTHTVKIQHKNKNALTSLWPSSSIG